MSASDPGYQAEEIGQQHVEQPQKDPDYDDDDEYRQGGLCSFCPTGPDDLANFSARILEKVDSPLTEIGLVDYESR